MNKFLERDKWPKLTQEETDNVNSPLSTKELTFTVLKLPLRKTEDTYCSPGSFYQVFKEETKLILHYSWRK